jgi:hypothetical protein
MSRFKVRTLRAALVVPLLMGSALVASAGHAKASINPDNVDRPKISAGDRDFGNKDIFGILSGGIVNWDETDSGTRSMCPKFTPRVSGILYVNNLAWQSTRVEVDYHEDVDHIIIKIDAFENGSWKTKGTAVEYRPADCTSDSPPI